MKIVYFGSGQFGQKSLAAINDSNHKLLGVYSQPPHRAGRGQHLTHTPIAQWARSHDVPLIETANVNTPKTIEELKQLAPDLLVVIAFGQKISQELIEVFPKRAINVHASLLPKYRGAAPINWAIIKGETHTGVSIITLAEKMDAGQVLAKATAPIGPDDTSDVVHDRLADLSPDVLLDTIDQIEKSTVVHLEQDHSQATLARKFKKSDGYIDWKLPAEDVRNKIRGMWPWPGAQAFYVCSQTGKTFRTTIALAHVVKKCDNDKYITPGMLDSNMNVICGEDALEIVRLKPAGKKEMDFKSFANGRAAKPGDLFAPIEQIK